MNKTEYRNYIQSEWWQNRRRKFLADYGSVCFDCGMPRWLCPVFYDQDMHVDHKNYQNLGAETDLDLRALCPRCHDLKHHGSSALPKPNPPTKCKSEGCDSIFANWGGEDECHGCLLRRYMEKGLELREWQQRAEHAEKLLDNVYNGIGTLVDLMSQAGVSLDDLLEGKLFKQQQAATYAIGEVSE